LSERTSSSAHQTEDAGTPASLPTAARAVMQRMLERLRGADRIPLSIALCALLLSIASIPPIWARLTVFTGNVVGSLQGVQGLHELQVSGPINDDGPKTTGSVTPPVAVEQRDHTPSDRIDALEKALDATRKTVEGLEQAVERMRTSERRLALTLILQSAMRDGRPFVNELDWLRRSASDDVTAAAVDVLLPYARRGVVTIADLRDVLFQSEFTDAVRRAALGETSYLDRVQRGVTGWIADVGMAQKPQPFEVDAILEEARLAIARGQIAESIASVQRLEGPPSVLLAPWIARAKVRLMIDEIVQRLLQSTSGPG
jgi:hypothetical protein